MIHRPFAILPRAQQPKRSASLPIRMCLRWPCTPKGGHYGQEPGSGAPTNTIQRLLIKVTL